MPVHINVGGVWKECDAVHINVGGVWKECDDAPVNVGGVWKTGLLSTDPLVSALANGDTNSRIGNLCYAGANFGSNGEEYEYTSTGGNGSSVGTWLDAGTSDQVWVEFIRTAGNQSKWDNRSNSVRYNMAGYVGFYIVDYTGGSGYETISGYFKFWDAASGGNLLDTTTTAEWKARYWEDACPTCCFTPDTEITMAAFTKPIGDIKVGDTIQTPRGYESVTEVIVRENRPMYRMEFDDGRFLNLSDDHPLAVRGKGPASINPHPTVAYKDLGIPATLEVGDYVITQDGSQRIKSFKLLDYPGTVYTLGNRQFYANGILVY